MRLNFATVLIVFLLLAVVGVEYTQYRQLQQHEQNLNIELAELRTRLSEMEERLVAAEKGIKQLDESSVEGLVKEANGAIIDGWQALIDSFESELKRARKSMNNQAGPAAP